MGTLATRLFPEKFTFRCCVHWTDDRSFKGVQLSFYNSKYTTVWDMYLTAYVEYIFRSNTVSGKQMHLVCGRKHTFRSTDYKYN